MYAPMLMTQKLRRVLYAAVLRTLLQVEEVGVTVEGEDAAVVQLAAC
jgi:hypothetical protein